MILNEVIAYLRTSWATAINNADIPVLDSPDPSAVNKNKFVAIGSEGTDDEGIVVDFTSSDLGPGGWTDETAEITCSAWSWSGGSDLAARRQEAVDLAETCIEAVRADRTFSGLIVGPGMAEVSSMRVTVTQETGGPLCRVTFTVSYRHLNT